MSGSLVDSLTELRDSLSQARLPLGMPGAADADRRAREMVAQLDDYILPRLETLDAPLLAVIGGSTGAGKSTLVNSLIGRVVSRPGVIRPTTRSPVLVHHPDDLAFFQSDRILAGLGRTFQQVNDTSTLQLVDESSLPQGLALLDAPDIDSVVKENRVLAAQLLAAADLWLFVTSAARYADAVPWEYLLSAAERSAAVAVVLDRIPPSAMHDVPSHLGALMLERGLGNSPLFAVPETATDDEGLLPDAAVSPIRDWLATIAADTRSRQSVVLQTLDGAIGSLTTRASRVAESLDLQSEAVNQLWIDAQKSYQEAARTIGVQTSDGTLLRGEVLARWQDFVGTGEFMRNVEQKIGWFRDRVVSVFRGDPPEAQDAKRAVQSGLEVLIRQEGESAAERTESSWVGQAAGRQLLTNTREDLSRASVEFPDKVARAIRDWQGDVMELVSIEGADKKAGARFLAAGVNGVGLALMIVVFYSTGGITGAEAGIAGGTVVLAQRLLEAFFGDDAVRRMARTAKDALDDRVQGLMADELARYRRVLDDTGVDGRQADAVRSAVEGLRRLRESGDYTIESAKRGELGSSARALGRGDSPEPGQGADAVAARAGGVPQISDGQPSADARPGGSSAAGDRAAGEDRPAGEDRGATAASAYGQPSADARPGGSSAAGDRAAGEDRPAGEDRGATAASAWGPDTTPTETVQGEVLDPADPTQGRRVEARDGE